MRDSIETRPHVSTANRPQSDLRSARRLRMSDAVVSAYIHDITRRPSHPVRVSDRRPDEDIALD